MKTLLLPALLGLLVASVCLNVLQYRHAQRLEWQLYVNEYDARTIHHMLDQEQAYLQALTQQVMEVANIDDAFRARYYAKAYVDAASEYDLDPRLLLFLTLVESGFDAQAKSSKGALGMMQIMPDIWTKRISFISTHKDLMDPYLNIHAGAHVLRHYLNRADGNVKLALLMYNRGERAVNQDILEGRDPSNGFARNVLFNQNQWVQPRAAVGHRVARFGN